MSPIDPSDELMTLALRAAAVSESQAPLTLSQGRKLNEVIEALRSADNLAAAGQWSLFIEGLASSGGAIDVNALVQLVLRESYLSTTEDLYDTALSVIRKLGG